MSTVAISTVLPISAQRAATLARKPELMQFVFAPVLKLPTLKAPEHVEVGTAPGHGCGGSESSPPGPID